MAATLSLVSAHYTFSQLIVNGRPVGRDWQYVRQHTRGYQPTKGSQILQNDFRCQPGASNGRRTDIYQIQPGDRVALKQAYGGTGMAHPGPTQVYMSRAPNSVKDYAGDGDWYKVFEGLLCKAGNARMLTNNAWCSYMEDRIEFVVPQTLPAGEYLVRVEHVPLHGAHAGNAEYYYSCAQVKLDGKAVSGNIAGEAVKIPGVYKPTDPAVNFSVWGTRTTYPFPHGPGPEVISGGEMRGSVDGRDAKMYFVP